MPTETYNPLGVDLRLHCIRWFLSQRFSYDGTTPGAYFWADVGVPTDNGTRLFENSPIGSCGKTPLGVASGNVTYQVEFPAGKTINDYLGGSE